MQFFNARTILSGSDCDYYAKCSHYANQNQLDCTGEFTNLFIINVTFATIVTIVKAVVSCQNHY